MLLNWCWRRVLRVPWTSRRSNQSILKETSPEYLLEGLMLKLSFQCEGHLMQRTDSLEKTPLLGKTEGGRRGDNRGWDGWKASLTQWTWVWVSCRSWWWTRKPGVLQSMGLQRVGHHWVTELNWTGILRDRTNLCHEIKRLLLLGRKVMTNLDSIFKSRDITLPTKVRLVKAMVFPVVMYGCES